MRTGPPQQSRPTADKFAQALRAVSSPEQARILQSFFKTGPGQYGEGDRFAGVKVPVIRRLVREYRAMSPREALKLVRSPIHEERLGGLLLWVGAFETGEPPVRETIFQLYLQNIRFVNNWDLVDLSAPQIVGGYLTPLDWTRLEVLAHSELLWERRIAVLATFTWIRQGLFAPTLRLCRMLLNDPHDLMHKACGWMLREIGKRDRPILSQFLERHARKMPRTMLRYALEHYPAAERTRYMRRD